MSIQIGTVRQALNAVLGTISDQVLVYDEVPDHPSVLPCLIVYPPDSINYMVTRDTDLAVFMVLLLVSPRSPAAQEVLEGFMSGAGPLSIRQALYADRSLDDAVSNLKLLDVTSGLYSITVGASDQVIGCEFRVEVLA